MGSADVDAARYGTLLEPIAVECGGYIGWIGIGHLGGLSRWPCVAATLNIDHLGLAADVLAIMGMAEYRVDTASHHGVVDHDSSGQALAAAQ